MNTLASSVPNKYLQPVKTDEGTVPQFDIPTVETVVVNPGDDWGSDTFVILRDNPNAVAYVTEGGVSKEVPLAELLQSESESESPPTPEVPDDQPPG